MMIIMVMMIITIMMMIMMIIMMMIIVMMIMIMMIIMINSGILEIMRKISVGSLHYSIDIIKTVLTMLKHGVVSSQAKTIYRHLS